VAIKSIDLDDPVVKQYFPIMTQFLGGMHAAWNPTGFVLVVDGSDKSKYAEAKAQLTDMIDRYKLVVCVPPPSYSLSVFSLNYQQILCPFPPPTHPSEQTHPSCDMYLFIRIHFFSFYPMHV
jgi:hypothetical protein